MLVVLMSLFSMTLLLSLSLVVLLFFLLAARPSYEVLYIMSRVNNRRFENRLQIPGAEVVAVPPRVPPTRRH